MTSPPPTELPQPLPPKASLPIPRFVIASVILWLISCCVPSLDFAVYSSDQHRDETSTVYGVWTLAFGCFCGFYYHQFASFANPFLLAAYIFAWLRRPSAAAILSLAALLLALNTLLLFGHRLDADEGGVRSMYLDRLRIGFYLWLASILVALGGSLRNLLAARRQEERSARPR
jgi:hypothetical protein